MSDITKEEQRDQTAAPENPKKKKLRGYALVRVVMMCVFAAAFAVFATIYIMYLVRNAEAKDMTDKVMSGFNEITNPGNNIENTDPVIIPSVSTPDTEESGSSVPETQPETSPETDPVDEAYKEYVAQCLAEAKKMKENYPDFRGFIVIEGDTINLKYPILQSDDNEYYVGHLIDGTKNSTGEVFMDYRNDGEVLNNRNTVMYGHNMNDGTKFGQLKNYKRNGAFYTHNITVITTEAVLTFKPFSFYKTDIYNPYTTTSFKDDKAFADFCVSEQARSMFESKYEFTGGERIITLSTCYGTSATERYCLHAVLVDIAK